MADNKKRGLLALEFPGMKPFPTQSVGQEEISAQRNILQDYQAYYNKTFLEDPKTGKSPYSEMPWYMKALSNITDQASKLLPDSVRQMFYDMNPESYASLRYGYTPNQALRLMNEKAEELTEIETAGRSTEASNYLIDKMLYAAAGNTPIQSSSELFSLYKGQFTKEEKEWLEEYLAFAKDPTNRSYIIENLVNPNPSDMTYRLMSYDDMVSFFKGEDKRFIPSTVAWTKDVADVTDALKEIYAPNASGLNMMEFVSMADDYFNGKYTLDEIADMDMTDFEKMKLIEYINLQTGGNAKEFERLVEENISLKEYMEYEYQRLDNAGILQKMLDDRSLEIFLIDEERDKFMADNPGTSKLKADTMFEVNKHPYGDYESELKNVWDITHMAYRDMYYNFEQGNLNALPQFIFADYDPKAKSELQSGLAKYIGAAWDLQRAGMFGLWMGGDWTKGVNKVMGAARDWFNVQYKASEERYEQGFVDNPDWAYPEAWDTPLTQSTKEMRSNPAYWVARFGQNAAYTTAMAAATGLVIATGGAATPYVVGAGMALMTPIEAQSMWDELILAGATEEEAAMLSAPIGTAIASVENMPDIFYLRALGGKAVTKSIVNAFRKNMARGVTRALVREGAKTVAMQTITETIEEVIQGAMTNATVSMFDENRGIFDNMGSTIVETIYTVLPFALIGGAGSVRIKNKKLMAIDKKGKEIAPGDVGFEIEATTVVIDSKNLTDDKVADKVRKFATDNKAALESDKNAIILFEQQADGLHMSVGTKLTTEELAAMPKVINQPKGYREINRADATGMGREDLKAIGAVIRSDEKGNDRIFVPKNKPVRSLYRGITNMFGEVPVVKDAKGNESYGVFPAIDQTTLEFETLVLDLTREYSKYKGTQKKAFIASRYFQALPENVKDTILGTSTFTPIQPIKPKRTKKAVTTTEAPVAAEEVSGAPLPTISVEEVYTPSHDYIASTPTDEELSHITVSRAKDGRYIATISGIEALSMHEQLDISMEVELKEDKYLPAGRGQSRIAATEELAVSRAVDLIRASRRNTEEALKEPPPKITTKKKVLGDRTITYKGVTYKPTKIAEMQYELKIGKFTSTGTTGAEAVAGARRHIASLKEGEAITPEPVSPYVTPTGDASKAASLAHKYRTNRYDKGKEDMMGLWKEAEDTLGDFYLNDLKAVVVEHMHLKRDATIPELRKKDMLNELWRKALAALDNAKLSTDTQLRMEDRAATEEGAEVQEGDILTPEEESALEVIPAREQTISDKKRKTPRKGKVKRAKAVEVTPVEEETTELDEFQRELDEMETQAYVEDDTTTGDLEMETTNLAEEFSDEEWANAISWYVPSVEKSTVSGDYKIKTEELSTERIDGIPQRVIDMIPEDQRGRIFGATTTGVSIMTKEAPQDEIQIFLNNKWMSERMANDAFVVSEENRNRFSDALQKEYTISIEEARKEANLATMEARAARFEKAQQGEAEKHKAVISETKTDTERVNPLNKIRNVVNNYFLINTRMNRIVDALDSYTTHGNNWEHVWQPLNDALDTKLHKMARMKADIIAISREHGMELRDFEERNVTVKGISNKLSHAEVVGVYLHSLCKYNKAIMLQQTVSDTDVRTNFTEEMITEIIGNMTEADKDMAKYIQQYNKRLGFELDIIRQYALGKPMRQPMNYMNIETRTGSQIIVTTEDLLAKDLNMVEASTANTEAEQEVLDYFTHKRTSFHGLLELDALHLFEKHVMEAEHYIAFMPAVQQSQTIINTGAFQSNLKQKFGAAQGQTGQLQVMQTWLKQVAQTQPMKPAPGEAGMRTLRVHAVMAHLGFNMLSAARQLPSAILGAQHIGLIPYLKGVSFCAAHRDDMQEIIKQHFPQIANRSWEREVAALKAAKSVDKRLGGALSKREAFMWLATTADRVAVDTVLMGAYLDHLHKGFTHEESVIYAEETIERTQPVFSAKDVAQTYRGTEIWKLLTVYTNQLNQNFNYFMHDIIGSRKAGKISTSKALGRFMNGLVVPAMLISAIGRSSPADDAEEMLSDLTTQAIMAFPGIGREMAGLIQGYRGDMTPITLSIIQEAFDTFAYMGDENLAKAGEKAAGTAAYALGVPLISGKRVVKSGIKLYEAAKKEADLNQEMIWEAINEAVVGEFSREKAVGDEIAWKNAIKNINLAQELLGDRDQEGTLLKPGEQMNMTAYNSVIRDATRSIDPNMITTAMGFPMLAQLVIESKQVLQQYDNMPSEPPELRRSFRMYNPESDALLTIFKGMGMPITENGKRAFFDIITMFDIPLDAIDKFSMTEEEWQDLKKELKIRGYIQQGGV